MPIPDLDAEGLLPAGLHECVMAEIAERFGQFSSCDRRPKLYGQLVEYVRELAKAKLVSRIVVDGSFVTGKPDPGDIDMVLIGPSPSIFADELRPSDYNLLSHRRVKKLYGFDVFLAREGSSELTAYIEFFQQVRGAVGRRKGILVVSP
jgi:hypothetical protein